MVMGHVLVSLAIVMAACGGSPAPAPAPPTNTARETAAPPPVELAKPQVALDAPTHSFGAAVTRMGLYRDAMCVCRDKPCIDELTDKMTRWGQVSAKTPDTETPSEAKQREMGTIIGELTKCMTTVLNAQPTHSYVSAGATAEVASNTQAPSQAPGVADAVVRMGQFRDAMCKCTDKRCVEEVTEQMARWGQETAKGSGSGRSGGGGRHHGVTEADTTAMAAVTEEMTKCMIVILVADAQQPPPAPQPAPPTP